MLDEHTVTFTSPDGMPLLCRVLAEPGNFAIEILDPSTQRPVAALTLNRPAGGDGYSKFHKRRRRLTVRCCPSCPAGGCSSPRLTAARTPEGNLLRRPGSTRTRVATRQPRHS